MEDFSPASSSPGIFAASHGSNPIQSSGSNASITSEVGAGEDKSDDSVIFDPTQDGARAKTPPASQRTMAGSREGSLSLPSCSDASIPSEYKINESETLNLTQDAAPHQSESEPEDDFPLTQIAVPVFPQINFKGAASDFNVPFRPGLCASGDAPWSIGANAEQNTFHIEDAKRKAENHQQFISGKMAEIVNYPSGQRLECIGRNGILVTRGARSFALVPKGEGVQTKEYSTMLRDGDVVAFGAGLDPSYDALAFTVSVPKEVTDLLRGSRHKASPGSAAAASLHGAPAAEEPLDYVMESKRASLMAIHQKALVDLQSARTPRGLGAVAGSTAKALQGLVREAPAELLAAQGARREAKKARKAVSKAGLERFDASHAAWHAEHQGGGGARHVVSGEASVQQAPRQNQHAKKKKKQQTHRLAPAAVARNRKFATVQSMARSTGGHPQGGHGSSGGGCGGGGSSVGRSDGSCGGGKRSSSGGGRGGSRGGSSSGGKGGGWSGGGGSGRGGGKGGCSSGGRSGGKGGSKGSKGGGSSSDRGGGDGGYTTGGGNRGRGRGGGSGSGDRDGEGSGRNNSWGAAFTHGQREYQQPHAAEGWRNRPQGPTFEMTLENPRGHSTGNHRSKKRGRST
jgi:hypothetical protein